MVAFDEDCRKVKLSLRQADILKALAEDDALSKQGGCVPDLQVIKQWAIQYVAMIRAGADTFQPRRLDTGLPPRIWALHVGGNARKAMGNRIQGPVRRRTEYEMAVGHHH